MNTPWQALEVADVVVVVVAIDVMDVPAIWNAVAGIQPNLAMKACAFAASEERAARVVVEAPRIASIHDTTIFNDLDHVFLSIRTSWHFTSYNGTSPRPLT